MEGLARDLGRLVQAVRGRRGISQQRLAELVGTSQQWLSRVERGATNPRLGEVERIFDVLGLRVQLGTVPKPVREDPDLVAEWTEAYRGEVVDRYRYYLRRSFKDVTFVVAGRLAAVVQGAPVRVFRLDLAVTEAELDAFRRGLEMTAPARWNERWQEYRDLDSDPRGPGPRRWLLSGYDELRLQVVEQLPAPLVIPVGGLSMPVWPLADLETSDDDVAEVLRRVRVRGGLGGGL